MSWYPHFHIRTHYITHPKLILSQTALTTKERTMGVFVLASFLSVLPFVMSTTCPDGTHCPGVDTCCKAGQEYTCCSIDGGDCCSDGMACCAPGSTCLPEVDICVPFFSNDRTKKIVAHGIQSQNPKANICPTGTTDCGKVSGGEECCPLPNAVCCVDGERCCPSGYTCDLFTGMCSKNFVYSRQNMKALKKTVQKVICPDGEQCSNGNTCCSMANGIYGCCQYPNAICCSDNLHCCPSGSKCITDKGKCQMGQYFIPWMQKIPTVKATVD